jgi:hypothetical protein
VQIQQETQGQPSVILQHPQYAEAGRPLFPTTVHIKWFPWEAKWWKSSGLIGLVSTSVRTHTANPLFKMPICKILRQPWTEMWGSVRHAAMCTYNSTLSRARRHFGLQRSVINSAYNTKKIVENTRRRSVRIRVWIGDRPITHFTADKLGPII